MKPLITIGIPTYNRAELLRESLASALGQSSSGVEVIISDNASEDHTQQVVADAGCGVRYYRNDTNIGAIANFFKLIDLANGEYFAWLQDDDVLFQNFISTAICEFRKSPDAVAFIAFALLTSSTKCVDFMGSALFGPPIPLDWQKGTSRIIEPGGFLPWCLLQHVGFSPTVLFKTDVLRAAIGELLSVRENIYAERFVVARLSAAGRIIVSPTVLGILRNHDQSASHANVRKMRTFGPSVFHSHWRELHDFVLKYWSEPDALRESFLADVAEVGDLHRDRLHAELSPFTSSLALASEITGWMDDRFGPPISTMRISVNKSVTEGVLSVTRRVVKSLVPPALWRAARAIWRFLRPPAVP
jgi:glycosyltransferase involved in cell wall biosynthesis